MIIVLMVFLYIIFGVLFYYFLWEGLHDADPKKFNKRFAARLTLLFPFWPLFLLILVVIFIAIGIKNLWIMAEMGRKK